jgi:3-deoxy-D-manno-octulosonic-acid transferase
MFWNLKKAAVSLPAFWEKKSQHFGYFPLIPQNQPVIWVNADHISEIKTGLRLLSRLEKIFPSVQFVFTSLTPEADTLIGRKHKQLNALTESGFSPMDIPGALTRFFHRVNPIVLYNLSPKLSPNLLKFCLESQTPVFWPNAHTNDAKANYQCRFSTLIPLSISAITFTTTENSEVKKFLVNYGIPAERCRILPDTKFDLDITEEMKTRATELRRQVFPGNKKILIAASTHPEEHNQIIEAFNLIREIRADVHMIIAPRFAHTFGTVESLLKLTNKVLRLSNRYSTSGNDDVLLIDTIGDLDWVLGAGDLAFIGGSLIEAGGHNLLEPANWGIPIVTGPSLFNYRMSKQLFLGAGALNIVNDAGELSATVIKLIEDERTRATQSLKLRELAALFNGSIDEFIELTRPFVEKKLG